MLAVFFGMPGWGELLVLGIIGLLIFGKRLPEVGKNLGRGIVEFKKGLSGIEDQVRNSGTDAGASGGTPPLDQPSDTANLPRPDAAADAEEQSAAKSPSRDV